MAAAPSCSLVSPWWSSPRRTVSRGELTTLNIVIVTPALYCDRRGPEDIMLGFGDHQLSYRDSPLDTHEVRLDVEEIIVHPGYRMWVNTSEEHFASSSIHFTFQTECKSGVPVQEKAKASLQITSTAGTG